MIVLDTNVLSELVSAVPATAVKKRIAAQPATSLLSTAVTQAEIRNGILLLSKGEDV